MDSAHVTPNGIDSVSARGNASSTSNLQVQTAQCFHVLRAWHQSATNAATRAQLAQIYSTLCSAAYAAATTDTESPIQDDLPVGQEYFSLLCAAESRLAAIESDIARKQTKLKMEKALQADLLLELASLDADLEQVWQKHRQVGDEVENEQTAVVQLEHEYAMLLAQEGDMKRECALLNGQLEKQQALLRDLREHSAFLEYISHAPMKRHMEERKQQEKHEALVAAAEAAKNDNRKLEEELERLEKQADVLEQQYATDIATQVARKAELESAREEHRVVELSYTRVRECHTPRPHWSDIIERTPELSMQKYEWDLVDDGPAADTRLETTGNSFNPVNGTRVNPSSLCEDDGNQSAAPPASGQTRELVKEMLAWIERLQKHCGVNLHLSRVSCYCYWPLSWCLAMETGLTSAWYDPDLARCGGSASGTQHPPSPTGPSSEKVWQARGHWRRAGAVPVAVQDQTSVHCRARSA